MHPAHERGTDRCPLLAISRGRAHAGGMLGAGQDAKMWTA